MQYGDYFFHAFSAPLTISSCAEAIEIDPEVMPLWRPSNHFSDENTRSGTTTLFESRKKNDRFDEKASAKQTLTANNLEFSYRDVVKGTRKSDQIETA